MNDYYSNWIALCGNKFFLLSLGYSAFCRGYYRLRVTLKRRRIISYCCKVLWCLYNGMLQDFGCDLSIVNSYDGCSEICFLLQQMVNIVPPGTDHRAFSCSFPVPLKMLVWYLSRMAGRYTNVFFSQLCGVQLFQGLQQLLWSFSRFL